MFGEEKELLGKQTSFPNFPAILWCSGSLIFKAKYVMSFPLALPWSSLWGELGLHLTAGAEGFRKGDGGRGESKQDIWSKWRNLESSGTHQLILQNFIYRKNTKKQRTA